MWIQPLQDEATRKLLLVTLGIDAASFPASIHPRDEMYLYNLSLLHDDPNCAAVLYFFKGFQVATAIEEVGRMLFTDTRASSFLDFGSGFGRATRFLCQRYPNSQMWVSDIVAEAVDFQRDYFQVNGFYSHASPAELAPGRRFQYVFASSLFSHLPTTTFGPWLRCLFDLLEGDGGLVFSVLDRSQLTTTATNTAVDGHVFFPHSESALDPAQYGTTYVSEDFVKTTLRAELGDDISITRLVRALCSHQDLYLVSSGRGTEPTVARIAGFPSGELDTFEVDNTAGRAKIAGWARVEEVEEVEEVRIFVRGELYGNAELQATTEATVRWTATLDLEDIGLDDMVAAVAKSTPQRENIVAIGTLRPFLKPERSFPGVSELRAP